MSSQRNLFNPSSSKESTRANWSSENITLFLELVAFEKNSGGNWQGKSLSVKGYENVIRGIQQSSHIFYTKKQLKSKYEALRTLFNLWTKMFNNQTGGGYDVATGKLVMDSEWWESKISVNNEYKKFRDEGLPNGELMFSVYGGSSATGAHQFTPTANNPTFRQPFSQFSQETQSPTQTPEEIGSEENEVNSPVRARQQPSRSSVSGGKRKSLDYGPPEQPIPTDYNFHVNDASDALTYQSAYDKLVATKPFLTTELYMVALQHMDNPVFRKVWLTLGDMEDRVMYLTTKK